MGINLTPLDGRYYEKIKDLVPYLSEYALIKHRILIEVEWLKKFMSVTGKPLENSIINQLDKLTADFNEKDMLAIKKIENEVNHDVKAVEIWICQFLKSASYDSLVPFVHFGRTSEDINNLAYGVMLKGARDSVLLPGLKNVQKKLSKLSSKESESVMISRTHGQAATTTTLGKELAVFSARLSNQLGRIQEVTVLGKFNGATGTYAADLAAYPNIDWPKQMQEFVESLGLVFNPLTTQIEPHDWIARLNNEQALANTICIDLARDCWQYISDGYMTQKVINGEVGSSTMPHKVNPIDFENAEANFGVANALLNHLSAKLPISRLQRDLSDSSALRSLSEAYGHTLVAIKSLERGLSKIKGNPAKMKADLDNQWALLTEAIQTVMRKNGIDDAYNQMKSLSRGKRITKVDIHTFIKFLKIDKDDKKRLLNLTPSTYIGLAKTLSE